MLPLQILRLRGEAWSYPECHCTWIAHCALNRVCLSHKTLEPLHKIQSRVAGLDDIAGETSAQQLGRVLKPQNCLTSRHERQEQQPPPPALCCVTPAFRLKSAVWNFEHLIFSHYAHIVFAYGAAVAHHVVLALQLVASSASHRFSEFLSVPLGYYF